MAISLATIAGLDTTEVEEVRYENLAAGVFGFEVIETEMLDHEIEKDNVKEARIKVNFKLKVLTVESTVDPKVDHDSLVGKVHTETVWINNENEKDFADTVGQLKSFVRDMGVNNSGMVQDYVKRTEGHKFTGKVTHRKNKDNPDIVYANIKLPDLSKVEMPAL